MTRSIAVFGAGPALGGAVARRYAKEGYEVVLVARRPEPLETLSKELRTLDATVHVVAADLSDVDGLPQVAAQIREVVGDLDALYYGAAANGFLPAVELTPRAARDLMPLGVYAPLALIQAFLPAMLTRRQGAILTAQGASAVHGMPYLAGGLALAAQRNYLQSLHAEVADQGVYVGGLYIGAVIEHSAYHDQQQQARAAGQPVPDLPVVDPADLANQLWNMHRDAGPPEATYPLGLFTQ